MSLQTTTWQTVGPFFRLGLQPLFDADIAGVGALGDRIAIEGRVLDGAGKPIPDAVLEFWQANAEGKYAHPADLQDRALEPGFKGFGRLPTGDDGTFRFTTVKPGPVPGLNGATQAPHIVVSLMMRGLLRGLVTRIYFPEEPLNGTDPVLNLIGAERRDTLLLTGSPEHKSLFHWQIHMQGPHETVFLDF